MSEPATAADIGRLLADLLEAEGIPYAIGGALALGFYAVPRATVDVDINIFVSPEKDIPRILRLLEKVGFVADEDDDAIASQARDEGQFRGRLQGLRVDVFVPAIPYYASLEARAREVTLLGRRAMILSPEDLAVLKMVFFRRKDVADVEALLRDQRDSLDRRFVRSTLVDLVGEDEPRLAELDQITREVDEE